ncbi:TetR/AcrR family transcriptional regulator [Bosea vestrisii]|uniref:TetR/AcrR family transcriptional regulator n=1 Tax=Bosea vestrisii TaxID=151416 RepID=A0ABW0HE36_9HYPH
MANDGTIRQRIIDAALDIVEAQGIKALTQPRVAKATGLRQSHLTYYFPRKADLFVALLEGSHGRAANAREGAPRTPQQLLDLLPSLMLDRARMRFFLSIILEASEDPELRSILNEHARGLAAAVAPCFGREPDDPAVVAYVDQVRGIGLRALLAPAAEPVMFDPADLARQFGLQVQSQAA